VPEPLAPALDALRPLLLDPERLVRAVAAGRRRGSAPPAWRRVELRPVELKSGRRLQVVRFDERQAHTENVPYDVAAVVVDELTGQPYGNWHVDTSDGTVQLRVTKKGEAQLHRSAALRAPDHAHDRAKPRLIDPGDPLFGVVCGSGDKRRQVDAFLRALDPVLDLDRLAQRPLRVVDLGCGNAYLTFATYRFLTAYRKVPVELTGVDVRPKARERNTALAREFGWDAQVRFLEGTIRDADVAGADVVLALHACDTATDEALARAVRWAAPLILAAPCCHHDVQVQLRRGSAPGAHGLLTRHGILRERFADVLTDSLRAALLRLVGYRVEVVEFVGTEHTPRNLLIRAVRTGRPPTPALVEEYGRLVDDWQLRPKLAELLSELLSDLVPGPVPR
jgi:SAM-dependent methyltransferase